MTIEDRFVDLSSLADRSLFAMLYAEVASDIAKSLDLKHHIFPQALDHASDLWTLGYQRTLQKRYSDHRHVLVATKILIQSLATASVVEYRRDPAVGTNVIDRHAGVVAKYPNEITSLVAGAVLYSLQMKRLTGMSAAVPLTSQELETAAVILHKRPDKAKAFRKLLKLSLFRPLFKA